MRENTLISGWSIKHGDYVSGANYKKAYPATTINRKRRERMYFQLYNAIGISGMILILSILLKI